MTQPQDVQPSLPPPPAAQPPGDAASAASPTDRPAIHREHPLSPELMDREAVKIIARLQRHGYEAYLVGGCVRDLVLGIRPKDFDVATNATPRQIRKLFRNCRVIGRRFRLCHIFFKDKIIEVATFRADPLARLERDTAGRLPAAPPAAPAAESPSASPSPREAEVAAFQAGLTGEDDEEDLAPWERDEESAARELEAVHGRRVRAPEELAEALDDRNLRPRPGRWPMPGRRERDDDRGAEPTAAETPERAPADETATERGGRRARRRRRWRKLLDEPPPQGYGDAAEDARLRDFTLNALFYDPIADVVIDYVGGWEDLHGRLLRTIGDPDVRLPEDPVRILRAIKGAARAGLRIDPVTRAAMVRHRHRLAECSPRRLLEEILKLLASGASASAFRLMDTLGVTRVLLPEAAHVYSGPGAEGLRYLEALDRADPASLDPALLIAVLFYPVICRGWELGRLGRPGAPPAFDAPQRYNEGAAEVLADDVLRAFARRRSLSRRARAVATRLILAQRLLRRPRNRRRRAARLVAREWFDDAMRLLRIAVEAEDADREAVTWWENRAAAIRSGEPLVETEPEPLEPGQRRRRRRRRRGRRGGRRRRRSAPQPPEAGDATPPPSEGQG